MMPRRQRKPLDSAPKKSGAKLKNGAWRRTLAGQQAKRIEPALNCCVSLTKPTGAPPKGSASLQRNCGIKRRSYADLPSRLAPRLKLRVRRLRLPGPKLIALAMRRTDQRDLRMKRVYPQSRRNSASSRSKGRSEAEALVWPITARGALT
jgi:hypothetical protein